MNPDRERLEELRDLALRDLIDVDRQVTRGELSAEDADGLRRQYKREALAALDGMQTVAAGPEQILPAIQKPRAALLTGRRVLYAAGIVIAVLAAFLVQGDLLDRPPGGFVSGNEVSQSPPTTADLTKVTDAELEAVVNANPEVLGMRLALARRYVAKGRYDLAAVHYKKVLQKEPKNPEALTNLGLVMLKVGLPEQAEELVDIALEVDPELAAAWWVQANIRLYGLGDPGGAINSLDQLRGRTDLGRGVQRQVAQLRVKAQRMLKKDQ